MNEGAAQDSSPAQELFISQLQLITTRRSSMNILGIYISAVDPGGGRGAKVQILEIHLENWN